MRVPKFRVRDKRTGKIFPVGIIDYTIQSVYLEEPNGLYAERDFYEVEFMQFTGLKDKNGKEIYEGHIIKWSDGHDYYFGVVAYDKDYGNFGVIEDNDEDMSPFGYLFEWKNVEELEVIGNKYENPELLKGE